MQRLENKVAIITGATLGLGKAAALLFAREGASVVICDRGRTPENAESVLEEAEGLSGEISYKRSATSSSSKTSRRWFGSRLSATARSTSWSTTPSSIMPWWR
jgi:NAD(P)-dependent dehydrogenase (short-subunit alcohol dehydrogenase family)